VTSFRTRVEKASQMIGVSNVLELDIKLLGSFRAGRAVRCTAVAT
jgi:hypothetical protein